MMKEMTMMMIMPTTMMTQMRVTMKVRKIQDSCKEAMQLWGYARVEEDSKLKTFSPVIDLKQ